MRIYRIETFDGHGCFRGKYGDSLAYSARRDVHADGYETEPCPARHPAPWDDPEIREVFWPGVHYFGFDSISQLLRWFDSERIRVKMHELGGKVVEYDCDMEHCAVSRNQVIFEMQHATKVSERPIPTAS